MSIPDYMAHCDDVLQGVYDIPLNFTKRVPVIVDIGANVGAFALWASKRWEGCALICYEPVTENYKHILDLRDQNPNIIAFNTGVRSAAGQGVMFRGENNCGECSVHQDLDETTGEQIEARFIDAKDIPYGHILKIDTEGCEVEILSRLIQVDRGNEFLAILVEWHRESDRLIIDGLLSEHYQMCGAVCNIPERGVAKYVLKSMVKRIK